MQEVNETPEQNCVGLAVQREARCTNDLLGFSDEELLKLAACGAFLNVKAIQVDFNDCFNALIIGEKFTKEKLIWNPVVDDGDAFRLAALMRLHVCFMWDRVSVQREDLMDEPVTILYGDDSSATARKAIVIAVAHIARTRT